MSAKIDPQKAFLKEFKALPDLNFLPKRLFANELKYIFGSQDFLLFVPKQLSFSPREIPKRLLLI